MGAEKGANGAKKSVMVVSETHQNLDSQAWRSSRRTTIPIPAMIADDEVAPDMRIYRTICEDIRVVSAASIALLSPAAHTSKEQDHAWRR
jgi:hypothetical protein